MSNILAQQAELAAARVSPEVTAKMGFTAIVGIFMEVFTLFASCLNRETPDPAGVQAAVRDESQRNPQRLLRRTARRIRANATSPMEKSESFALARASIEQALAMSEETAEACAASVPNDLFLSEGD